MKLKKVCFLVVMVLLLCACFVVNNSSSFAVGRYVEVDNDDSYLKETYSVGATHLDSGGIYCEPLKATYFNDKYTGSYKEVIYRIYKIQANTETSYEILGNNTNHGTGSPIVTSSFWSVVLKTSHKRYAYGATHATSSSDSKVIGNAYITIVRTYPNTQSKSRVNEFDADEEDVEETDYIHEEYVDEEDLLE